MDNVKRKPAAVRSPQLEGYDTEKLLRDFAHVTSQRLSHLICAAAGELDHAIATAKDNPTHSMKVALTATERALALARNLRYFAAPISLQIQTVELSQLLLDAMDMFEREFEIRGQQVTVLAEAGTFLAADANAIRQIILNVLDFSHESLPRGGRLKITLQKNDHEAELSLVFHCPQNHSEPLFRTNSTTFADQRKTLAIAVVETLLETMGGQAEISSNENESNKISLRFPIDHTALRLPKYQNKRKHRRVHVHLPATLSLTSSKKFNGEVSVLGAGGAFLKLDNAISISPHDFEQSGSLEIFHFEDEYITIPKCRITENFQGDTHRGLGLAFEEISDKAKHILRSIIQGFYD